MHVRTRDLVVLMPYSAAWSERFGAKAATQRAAPPRQGGVAEGDALASAAGIIVSAAISIPIWAGLISLLFWLTR